ncbi:metallophosphoesterase [candidate division KSB1 bacterium]|nr:metallophosphoesterase [candidate division KSB1 bacterium]
MSRRPELRYAIISDIHSNLEALTAVCNDIEQQDVDEILCLGDIVGYGPDPNECIDMVKSICSVIITGNHDYACLERSEIEYFNVFASQSIFWTVEVLSDSALLFLSQLPFQENVENFKLVHASPDSPSIWNYILTLDQAIYNFSYFDEQMCFIGHTHKPVIYAETAEKDYHLERKKNIEIEEDKRYLINVGSVGQPRDSNTAASYAILDTDRMEYALMRVVYDFHKTQKKMVDSNLPNFLIERLASGR